MMNPIRINNKSAPNEIVGAVFIWLQDTFKDVTLELGKPADRPVYVLYPFGAGEPKEGAIRVKFSFTDVFNEVRQRDFDINCSSDQLSIGPFRVGYDDPEFFDELQRVVEHLVAGNSIYSLFPYELACEQYVPSYEIDDGTLEDCYQATIVPACDKGSRCRGPPGSKAELWHDGESLTGEPPL